MYYGLYPSTAVGTLLTGSIGIDVVSLTAGVLLGIGLSVSGVYLLRRRVDRSRYDGTRLSKLFQPAVEFDCWDPSRIPLAPGLEPAMSDNERVIRLLIANDGRMAQARIVSETNWSKAKVSRLLQRMEERGDVSRIATRRGNVVFLGSYTEGSTDDDRSRSHAEATTDGTDRARIVSDD